MASQAPNNLPLLYNELEPLNRNVHGTLKIRRVPNIPAMAKTHAIPVTVDEFPVAQRFFPIVFSNSEAPVPLALMGLHEETNAFFDAEGRMLADDVYVPAYLRRLPFLLARLSDDSEELSLCFDPTSEAVGDFENGEALFDGDEPSEATKAILKFCEQFEQAGVRTAAFVKELMDLDLLMEGEVAIQPEGAETPAIYRGFKMVDEEKFRNLRGDELRKLNQNGGIALIMSHLFSLSVIREVFARQVRQGTGPAGFNAPAVATETADA